jgi:phage tail sheath protein FI
VTAQFPPDLVPAAVDAALTFSAGSPDAAAVLGLIGAGAVVNVARYWVGSTSAPKKAQNVVQSPSDGTALPDSAAIISALAALDQVDLFNILCIPDATRADPGNPAALDPSLGSDPSVATNAIFDAAMSVCLQRRAFLIVDPPPYVTDVDGAASWKFTRLTVHDKNGAAYWPRPRLPDPLNSMQLRSFAPCGVVAGVYARTDADRGVWKAPAGIEARLAGVQQLTVKLTDADNGVINPLGLNALRNLPIYGMVSWGARTLVGADGDSQDWKYVPVRRLALYLQESLYRGLKWAVFEPNDEPLWAQIRLNVGSFLNGIFRQGGFAGKTPQEAYFVKCDKETTTPTDQALGVVNVLVGFAPLQPAEFVVITVQQMAGQTAI